MGTSGAWLDALENATVCLRGERPSDEELEECLVYLNKLEAILRSKEASWDSPPPLKPPVFEPSGGGDLSEHKEEPVSKPPMSPFGDDNPFASLDETYEDSDDYYSTDDDEAGDHIVKQGHRKEANTVVSNMDMRRILIRILDHQSSVHAKKAISFQKKSPPRWKLGAEQYGLSVQCVHNALILADTQISRWFAQDTLEKAMYQPLMEDANIVEVAVQTMTKNRDGFLRAARRQEAYLVSKLEAYGQSREAARSRMGDRWYENPRPKRDFAEIRKDHEKQLRDVRKALESMEHMEAQIGFIKQSTNNLKSRLLSTKDMSARHRYNGIRPADLSGRVDFTLYPDPTEFGWTFTGSLDSVEFFERDGVKLDWYFTTATVKTSLMHPNQGKTQLFGKTVDPDTYISLLIDPRLHTGQRYHRKP